jgi:hypothetical protein
VLTVTACSSSSQDDEAVTASSAIAGAEASSDATAPNDAPDQPLPWTAQADAALAETQGDERTAAFFAIEPTPTLDQIGRRFDPYYPDLSSSGAIQFAGLSYLTTGVKSGDTSQREDDPSLQTWRTETAFVVPDRAAFDKIVSTVTDGDWAGQVEQPDADRYIFRPETVADGLLDERLLVNYNEMLRAGLVDVTYERVVPEGAEPDSGWAGDVPIPAGGRPTSDIFSVIVDDGTIIILRKSAYLYDGEVSDVLIAQAAEQVQDSSYALNTEPSRLIMELSADQGAGHTVTILALPLELVTMYTFEHSAEFAAS